MKNPLRVGERVGLTADFLKFGCNGSYDHSVLRGEIIAIIGSKSYPLAVVQWDGIEDEDANHTYAIGNICRIKSNAFREMTHNHGLHERSIHG